MDHLTRSESLRPTRTSVGDTVDRTSSQAAQAKPGNDHLFVNNVRFISMAAVVAEHSLGALAQLGGLGQSGCLLWSFVGPFKFGTIGFFLISGFLMGEGLERRNSLEYLRRRIRTILSPWLAWFVLYAGLSMTIRRLTGRLGDSFSGHQGSAYFAWIQHLLFGTAYWFVPNLMLAICVLLLCKRFLARLWLGSAFLLLSIFYGIDAYTQWIPMQGHSQALFGFVFYLWLGAWAARNLGSVEQFILRVPASAIFVSAALFGMAAMWEAYALSRTGNTDPLNTLRISNQAYSVAVVLAIFKARRAVSPRALNVRSTTFGIYLSHSVILGLAINLGKRSELTGLFVRMGRLGAVAILPTFLCIWIAVYGCSLALTYAIASRPRLCWMVGVGQQQRVSVQAGNVDRNRECGLVYQDGVRRPEARMPS